MADTDKGGLMAVAAAGRQLRLGKHEGAPAKDRGSCAQRGGRCSGLRVDVAERDSRDVEREGGTQEAAAVWRASAGRVRVGGVAVRRAEPWAGGTSGRGGQSDRVDSRGRGGRWVGAGLPGRVVEARPVVRMQGVMVVGQGGGHGRRLHARAHETESRDQENAAQ